MTVKKNRLDLVVDSVRPSGFPIDLSYRLTAVAKRSCRRPLDPHGEPSTIEVMQVIVSRRKAQ